MTGDKAVELINEWLNLAKEVGDMKRPPYGRYIVNIIIAHFYTKNIII